MSVSVEVDGRGIATVTLDRPEAHNALDGAMMDTLHGAAERLGADASVRAVVLTGAGESFCAGGDLGWMRAQMGAAPEERAREARRLAGMLLALDRMPKALIGRVQGQAFGGGIGLMSVCDVAVGADHARFGLTEVRLGLIPATIGPYVAARMGAARARRVFFSGRRFDAGEAVALGLLARSVPAGDLDAAVEAEAAPYLAAAPGAVAEAKAQLRFLGPNVDEAQIADSVQRLVRRWEGEEAREGVGAFFEKRRPNWTA